jgi:two-component system, OmpR family, response regulator MprA
MSVAAAEPSATLSHRGVLRSADAICTQILDAAVKKFVRTALMRFFATVGSLGLENHGRGSFAMTVAHALGGGNFPTRIARPAPRILVVDDEPAVRQALARALELERYEISLAADAPEALELLAAKSYEAIVLDVLMPGMNGLELCRHLRRSGDRTPVLMLTARDAIDDRVAGLDAGADDYLAKPFALRELLARVRALLRRSGADGEASEALAYADLKLDPRSHEARRGARELTLTRTEFRLLEMFLRHPRQVLTRAVIMEDVWGYDFGASSNSLGVYLGYLRRKTEAGGEPRLLHTIRGVGYVLREQ